MLTLSLVFEDRDPDGLLTHHEKHELDLDTGLLWCARMVAEDIDMELRESLLTYIATYDPDALMTPADEK